jgi:hypothetical protein
MWLTSLHLCFAPSISYFYFPENCLPPLWFVTIDHRSSQTSATTPSRHVRHQRGHVVRLPTMRHQGTFVRHHDIQKHREQVRQGEGSKLLQYMYWSSGQERI